MNVSLVLIGIVGYLIGLMSTSYPKMGGVLTAIYLTLLFLIYAGR